MIIMSITCKHGMKFRIYPTKKQAEKIRKTFEAVRYVYNDCLDFRIDQYRCGNHIGYYEMNRRLFKLKHDGEHDWLNDACAAALQQSIRDLDVAYKNFFNGKKHYPKHKSQNEHDQSYRIPLNGSKTIIKNGRMKVPKLGLVRVIISKEIPENAKIYSITVRQKSSGKYYAVLIIGEYIDRRNDGRGQVGVDLGIKKFYTDSNGNKVDNPKFLKKSEAKLKKAQRKLSKMEKGSSNWEKQRVKVARIHEHISNQREDFLQKQSSKLVKRNSLIAIEDLDVKGMEKDRGLAKSIADVSWSKFDRMLEYKGLWYGCEIIRIPRYYPSSQLCSCCGYQYRGTKNRNIREWTCPNCGIHHDRDINAAINILNKGLEIKEKH